MLQQLKWRKSSILFNTFLFTLLQHIARELSQFPCTYQSVEAYKENPRQIICRWHSSVNLKKKKKSTKLHDLQIINEMGF